MTTHSRIAAFLSTSALCLGLAAAPGAYAADASAKSGETKTQAQHKHHKSDKSSAKHEAGKSGGAAKMDKSGSATPAK
ncbi:hypothetical protein EUC41_30535 [Achromobacter denitrificans]|jgi:hypothetical protein|uniref:Uncharacterized protein n=1 Tax=Achromobacter denitrificans TaxID=32002 RepID=A0A427WI59_ACHDE|nr:MULTISPECIES: hypothetical protein [Achromobacter]ASC66933.1 hypothetical protein B9P52_22810 [Achromobacter denitrificans]MBV2157496.1 hypothetical protein [Achromobacter denitrificans]MDF3851534.1 hypothetical protein [Achromobacter denitrificans]MDF3861154.1 hypothetical protein [Achromobacter denitrificans]MDF3941010.1 hypothetical protein [Achromobacter denitrificans]